MSYSNYWIDLENTIVTGNGPIQANPANYTIDYIACINFPIALLISGP